MKIPKSNTNAEENCRKQRLSAPPSWPKIYIIIMQSITTNSVMKIMKMREFPQVNGWSKSLQEFKFLPFQFVYELEEFKRKHQRKSRNAVLS